MEQSGAAPLRPGMALITEQSHDMSPTGLPPFIPWPRPANESGKLSTSRAVYMLR